MNITGSKRDLQHKTAVVTGSSSGVGLETAKQLLNLGCNVLLLGSNEQKLEAAFAELDSKNATWFAGDVRNSSTAEQAINKARSQFGGPVEILINSAGIIHRATAQNTSDEDWAQIMDVNVNGVFYFCRAFANQNDLTSGAIVNVSSTCGEVGAAGLAAYCASKGAVNQLTRAMALELAPQGITVNAVAPGAINSPMLFSKHKSGTTDQSVVQGNLNTIPLGAIAEPQEVARSLVFLSQEQHITGTILNVDGGYTAQ